MVPFILDPNQLKARVSHVLFFLLLTVISSGWYKYAGNPPTEEPPSFTHIIRHHELNCWGFLKGFPEGGLDVKVNGNVSRGPLNMQHTHS